MNFVKIRMNPSRSVIEHACNKLYIFFFKSSRPTFRDIGRMILCMKLDHAMSHAGFDSILKLTFRYNSYNITLIKIK